MVNMECSITHQAAIFSLVRVRQQPSEDFKNNLQKVWLYYEQQVGMKFTS